MTYYPSEPKLRANEPALLADLERLLSLIPVIIWAALFFKGGALLRILLSTVVVFALDTVGGYLQTRYLKRNFPRFRLRAALLGLLPALFAPSDLPIWILLIADLLTVLGLQIFGAESNLPISLPAAVGCILLLFPAFLEYPLILNSEEGARLADLLRAGDKPTLSVSDMLLGRMDGNMGEIASLLLILGGAYLLSRKQMDWRIPVAAVVGAGVVAYFTAPDTMSVYYYMGAQIFSGGFMLALLYIVSDRASAPLTARAGLLYGALYGVLTILLRQYTDFDGALPAALSVSLLARPIDHLLAPLPFGGRRR